MAITRSKSSQSIEATMTAALYELPNELIYTIVGFIKDRETLCAFAQVSKHCQEFAEASIYRAVLVRQSSDAYSIKKAIQKRPQRASHIHTINVRAAWYHKRKGLGYHMRFILSKCPNLQDLAVESPTCNYGRLMSSPDDTWRLEEQRILSGLKTKDKSSHLTKMTLELDGIQDRYWDPNQLGNADYCWGQVMALPTLTELKVSCALIHDNIKMAEPRSTRLKILELIECNISFEGLRRILCGPKALQRLHLGENARHGGQGYNLVQIYHNHSFNGLFALDPEAFIDALSQQSTSLEYFEYVAGVQQYQHKPSNKGFHDFTRLQEIRLSEHVHEDRRDLLVDTPNVRRLYLELPSSKILDPVIKLEEERDVAAGKLGPKEVEDRLASKVSAALMPELPKTALCALQELHITFPEPQTLSIPNFQGGRRTWIEMIGRYWRSRNVNLIIYCKDRSSIFPPVLYDMRAPREVLLYDTRFGFTPEADRPDLHDPFLDFGVGGHDVLENFDFDSFLHTDNPPEAFEQHFDFLL